MASSDNVAKESVTGICCVTGGESDGGGEDIYQSCGSDIDDDVDETTLLTAKVKLPAESSPNKETSNDPEILIENNNASTENKSEPNNSSHAGIAEASAAQECSDSDLMPEEQLDSDNSDMAGLYQVNSRNPEEAQNQAYQPGRLPSSSSDTFDEESDGDDSDIRAPRWRGTLSSSSSNSPEVSDSDSESTSAEPDIRKPQVDLSKVKVTSSIFSSVQNRMYGNVGRQQNHTRYTENLMSNLKFARRMKIVKKLDGHDGCVNALNFNQAGNWLASGSDDTKCVIWDMSTHKPHLKFKTGHHQNVFQCKFMPHSNDSQIVTCARDGMVRLAELSATGSCRGTKKLARHEGSAHKLAIETDSQHCLLSAGEDGLVYQIDLREKKPTKIVATKEQRRHIPLHSIDKHPTNPYEFITSGREHYIRVYDKRKISEGIFMPEVKKCVPPEFTDADSRIRDVTCAVYNHDGTEILGTYNDDDIFLFDNTQSDGADCIKTYRGHRNSQTVKGVNFYGPNSEYIVSGSDCGHVFLWDKSSEQIVQLQKADVGGVVNVLEPHPQFPFLAVSGLDHDVKLLMPVAEKPIDMKRHCRSIKRNIRQRCNSLSRHPEEVDGHLFWTIMRHLESRRRRAAAAAADDLDADDADNSSMDTDSDSDDDDESGRRRRTLSNVGCVTS